MVLFEAITAAQSDQALMGLDLDVLAGADTESRKEIFGSLDKGSISRTGFTPRARPDAVERSWNSALIKPDMVRRLA
jgi:hypothetical protein